MASKTEIIAKHHAVFRFVATTLQYYVLVRRVNPESYKYMDPDMSARTLRYDGRGQPVRIRYVPKPMSCKAKTADRSEDPYEWAGLAVDPERCKGAFTKPEAKPKVAAAWAEFEKVLGAAGSAYSVDTDPASRHYGCVKLKDAYIHGDYDLWDVVDPLRPEVNRYEFTAEHGMLSSEASLVMKRVNELLGRDMVQHGGEAQYGGFSEQPIDVYGPDGEEFLVLNELSLRDMYTRVFARRLPAKPTEHVRRCERCKTAMTLRRNARGQRYWQINCRCWDEKQARIIKPPPGFFDPGPRRGA